MAKPRVFISSTFYDLKHIRSSIERFIEDLGFEAILFEKGSIPYAPDLALDESCYRDASTADIFVLIVGGRYGSQASSAPADQNIDDEEFFESITKREFDAAYENGIPIYILIESAVASEYDTYLKNKNNTVHYAHVDNINVFKFIDEIYKKPINNPMHRFDRSYDIEKWLREQWSGLFRELLRTRRESREVAELGSRLKELRSVTDTLKSYLETLLVTQSPEEAKSVIDSESKRLEEATTEAKLADNALYRFFRSNPGFDASKFRALAALPDQELTPKKIKELLGKTLGGNAISLLAKHAMARDDFNLIRQTLGHEPIEFKELTKQTSKDDPE